MKKNLLSIIILALLIVNIVLTAIMMFSVVGASKQTSALVADIAAVLKLELDPYGLTEEEEVQVVPMEDVESYKVEDTLTIPLKDTPPVEGVEGSGSKNNFCMLAVSLSMNIKHKDYKTYGDLSTKEDIIKDIVIDEVSKCTAAEARDDTEALKQRILNRIQEMYDSDFIFGISFREIIIQ